MAQFSQIFKDDTRLGYKIPASEYLTSGKYPIIDQSKDFIVGYTDSVLPIDHEKPIIVFGDHTRVIKYIDEPFFIGADGVKVLKSKLENANYKYLFYALQILKLLNGNYHQNLGKFHYY